MAGKLAYMDVTFTSLASQFSICASASRRDQLASNNRDGPRPIASMRLAKPSIYPIYLSWPT